jgi:hypothetical protein
MSIVKRIEGLIFFAKEENHEANTVHLSDAMYVKMRQELEPYLMYYPKKTIEPSEETVFGLKLEVKPGNHEHIYLS